MRNTSLPLEATSVNPFDSPRSFDPDDELISSDFEQIAEVRDDG